MLLRDDQSRSSSPKLAVALLLVGVLIGLLIDPAAWVSALRSGSKDAVTSAPERLSALWIPSGNPAQIPENGLETLVFDIPHDAAVTLEGVRDRALAAGVIEQGPEHTVDATITFGGEAHAGTVRIKGDWTDHVSTRKWSLRVVLESGDYRGMRRFSIQNPVTRGFLWEWLIGRAAAYEGLLHPRSTFANVVINGDYNGIYFIEEHFAKEMLESQGRREGPIVKYDESTLWTARIQNHVHLLATTPTALDSAFLIDEAPAVAFSEKKLARTEALARQLHSAVGKLLDMPNLILAASDRHTRLRRLKALEDLQGRTVDDLFDTRVMARMHALQSLFLGGHGVVWHNLRFYANPVTERLEPILFDTAAGHSGSVEPIPWQEGTILAELGKSSEYYVGTFEHLGRMTSLEWIDGFLAAEREDLERFDRALHGEGLMPWNYRAAAVANELHAQAIALRELCLPRAGVNFVASLHEAAGDSRAGSDSDGGAVEEVLADIVVEAWASTRTPMVLEGFRFGNGRVVTAQEALQPSGTLGPENVLRRGDHGVALPRDSRRLVFRFPADKRLATLRDVESVKAAVLAQSAKDESVRLEVAAFFRPAAADELESRPLHLRRVLPQWTEHGAGRPAPPTLEEALATHAFLAYDVAEDELFIRPGAWDVEGDLVVPAGRALHARPKAVLRFAEGAILVTTGPLLFAGEPNGRITLQPREGAASWGGVMVLEAAERSEWNYVTVRRTAGTERGGWTVTGAVSFYRSAVTIQNSAFEDNACEDALNVISADFLVVDTRFARFSSDAFDGDFVTGRVQGCLFEDGAGDALDFSGCRVDIEDCRFRRVADKAVSIGEGGYAEATGLVVESAGIALASKDGSHLIARDVRVESVTQYAVTAYVKKPVYGPAQIELSGLEVVTTGRGVSLVQTGCELTLDGVAQPTEDLDVERLYREKILGT